MTLALISLALAVVYAGCWYAVTRLLRATRAKREEDGQ